MSAAAAAASLSLQPSVSRWRVLLRLFRLFWTVSPRLATSLCLIYAGSGLFQVAEVTLLRGLIDAAQRALQGTASLSPAIG